MPKKTRHFRLSDDHYAILEKYAQDHKLDNTTEALEQILSLSPKKPTTSASGASDLLPCRQRVTVEDKLSCMNPPTLYRKVKIAKINPEICRACQVLSKNLPDKYEVKETPTEETFDRGREPVTDPSRSDMNKAGMVWCPEGLWVFPLKCDKCRETQFRQWDTCQRDKLRKKGEQQRADTPSKP